MPYELRVIRDEKEFGKARAFAKKWLEWHDKKGEPSNVEEQMGSLLFIDWRILRDDMKGLKLEPAETEKPREGSVLLGAYKGDELVGLCQREIVSDRISDGFAYVDPEHRRKGLLKLFREAYEKMFKWNGHDRIALLLATGELREHLEKEGYEVMPVKEMLEKEGLSGMAAEVVRKQRHHLSRQAPEVHVAWKKL